MKSTRQLTKIIFRRIDVNQLEDNSRMSRVFALLFEETLKIMEDNDRSKMTNTSLLYTEKPA